MSNSPSRRPTKASVLPSGDQPCQKLGAFEAAVGAVDGLNLSGGDIDGLQKAAGGGVLHQRGKEEYRNHHGLTVPSRATPPARSDVSARADDPTPSCRRASRAPRPDRQTSGRDRA